MKKKLLLLGTMTLAVISLIQAKNYTPATVDNLLADITAGTHSEYVLAEGEYVLPAASFTLIFT